MSSTITHGRHVNAIRALDGTIYYLLFEKTCESNVFPKVPKWSCIGFATLKNAMKRIFEVASSCEGGMLQNKNGRITPEGYISTWLTELADPYEFSNQTIHLRHEAGNPWFATITDANIDQFIAALLEAGLVKEAEQLRRREEIKLDLFANAAFLAQLVANGLPPWRLFSAYEHLFNAPRRTDLGYAPKPTKKFALTIPQARKIDEHNLIMPDENGVWRCAGWEYSNVGAFVSNLWRDELKEPHSYRKRIKAFRDSLQAAPRLPDDARVIVMTPDTEESFYRERREKLISTHAMEPFLDGLATLATPSAIYHAADLPSKTVTWIFNENTPSQPALF